MAGASNPLTQTWIPKESGKGGTYTNSTYHDQVPDSTQTIQDCIVQNNAWVPNPGVTSFGFSVGAPPTTLAIFNRYTGNSQALTSSLVAGITNDGVGKSKVVNQTSGAVIRSSATVQPTTGTGRYVFAPVKNRLYMANGTDLPVISADATAGSCIPWGFAGQAQNLTYDINVAGTAANAGWVGGTKGTCTVNGAGTIATWATGPNFQYFVVGQPIVIGGVRTTVSAWTSNTQISLSPAVGLIVGTPPFSYAPTGITGTATYATGSANMTVWSGPAFVPGTPFPALGSPVYPLGNKYLNSVVTGAATMTITPVATASINGAAIATQINVSNITFDGGGTSPSSYQYAVSYYNTTSGHVTNPSPILVVKDAAPNNCNVSITIMNILATNDPNYTKIILWRSTKGGGNLFPLAILNNDTGNTTGGRITYTDTQGDDSTLGSVVGGPGLVACPTAGQNSPPPADINYPTYWQGRFWAASQLQIGLIFFSARSAGLSEDTTVGVPEECWPANFTLAVPETDGRVTGFRTVGNNLFVLTDNAIYAVVGQDKTSYGLSKVSAKGSGTAHFATCVIPAEDSNSSDVLVHVGNDGRLYFMFGSGGDYAISYPIQDQLNALGMTAAGATVGTIHTATSAYIYLLPASGGKSFIYDLERKIWTQENNLSNSTGFVEGLYNGSVVQFYGSTSGYIYLGNQTSGTPIPWMILTTNTTTFGTDRKDDKILQSVTIYTNDPTNIVGVNVAVDNNSVNLVQLPSTGTYGPAFHEYSDSVVFVPQNVCRGRLFSFTVVLHAATYSSAIYEITARASNTQDPPKSAGNL